MQILFHFLHRPLCRMLFDKQRRHSAAVVPSFVSRNFIRASDFVLFRWIVSTAFILPSFLVHHTHAPRGGCRCDRQEGSWYIVRCHLVHCRHLSEYSNGPG